MGFNPNNPTGRYKLDLGTPAERAVATRLLLVDEWEVSIGHRLERFDTSQEGNRSHFHNVEFRGHTLHTTLAEWRLPEFDVIEFDYSSSKRPPLDSMSLPEAALGQIIHAVQFSECGLEDKITAVRLVSHRLFFKASQLRELLNVCPSADQRADFLVVLLFQLTDIQNVKIIRVRLYDSKEWDEVWHRLGYVHHFPFVQTEQAHFELDFCVYEQRLAANLLMQLSVKENAKNLHEPTFTDAEGVVDVFESGVPRTWELLEKIPTKGVFRVTYNCLPEHRNFQTRLRLL